MGVPGAFVNKSIKLHGLREKVNSHEFIMAAVEVPCHSLRLGWILKLGQPFHKLAFKLTTGSGVTLGKVAAFADADSGT